MDHGLMHRSIVEAISMAATLAKQRGCRTLETGDLLVALHRSGATAEVVRALEKLGRPVSLSRVWQGPRAPEAAMEPSYLSAPMKRVSELLPDILRETGHVRAGCAEMLIALLRTSGSQASEKIALAKIDEQSLLDVARGQPERERFRYTKCFKCQFQSSDPALFVTIQPDRSACLDCVESSKYRHPHAVLAASGVLIGVGLLLAKKIPALLWIYLNLALFSCIMLPLAYLVVALAWGAAASAVGFQVFSIQWGVGKALGAFSAGRIRFAVHQYFYAARVEHTPRTLHRYRLRYAVFYLAPYLLMISLAAVCVFTRPGGPWTLDWARSIAPAQCLVATAVWMVATLKFNNLASILRASDAQLLRQVSPVEFMRTQGRFGEVTALWQAAMRNAPDSAGVCLETVESLLDEGRYNEANWLCTQFLAGQRTPYEQALISSLRGRTLIMRGDPPSSLEEAGGQALLSEMPWNANLISLRGSILAVTGPFDEAVALLQEANHYLSAPRAKTYNACFLAMAWHQLGEPLRSQQALKAARMYRKNIPFVAITEKRLEANR